MIKSERKGYKMENDEIKKRIKEMSVLFVDDEDFVVETMKEVLPILFKESYFALNGEDGLEILKIKDIDVVITDISMPKMCGQDMVNSFDSKELKVIFLSGHNEKDYLEMAKKVNGSFIVKPISSKELFRALREVL